MKCSLGHDGVDAKCESNTPEYVLRGLRGLRYKGISLVL